MTKLTFSSILSARNVLDPDCFKKKPFAGGVHHDFLDCVEKPAKGSQQPAIVRRSNKGAEENESLKEGFLLQQWMDTGVYEAIDKQYLKTLSLIIAKSDNVQDELSDEVLENYTIKYQYADNGDVLMATNEDGEAVLCNKENSTCNCIVPRALSHSRTPFSHSFLSLALFLSHALFLSLS
jgi:hypothetical protein